MENEIEYLQKLIAEKQEEADCIDRKDSQEAYLVYSALCSDVRLLKSIMNYIVTSEYCI